MSLRFGLRALPNLLVFAVLAGIAWWGHRSGWNLTAASARNGSSKPKDDWCEAHSVPESLCVECDATLLPRPKSFGWCRIHGVHECPLCHPELGQLATPYKVTDADRERAMRALATDRPENSRTCTLYQRRIQFATVATAEKSGLDIDTARRAAIRETIPVYGEITYDSARVAHLSSRSAGSVAKVLKHIGDHVGEGDVLALVDAADVGKAKADFLQAARQLDARQRNRDAMQSSVIPEVAIRNAETALSEAKIHFLSARQALINLGLPRTPDDFKLLSDESAKDAVDADLAKRLHFLGISGEISIYFVRESHSNNLLPLRAPSRGVIVSRDVVPGEVVDVTRMLFEVVDTSQVWLMLDVRAEDVAKITIGASKVLFKPDGLRKEIAGVVTWISTDADAKTRTVKVRAELDNPKGELRANTFGFGRIVLRDEPEAIVVPSSAVHWEGDCHIVFVRDKNWLKEGSLKVFHTRVVRPGWSDDKVTEIIAGVLPDEVVAAKGSEVLRAELLRGNLGEG